MFGLNKIYNMDCIEGMKQIPGNYVDAIVTDPPYGLEFMGKDWDAPWKDGKAGVNFNTSCKGKLGGFKQLPNNSRVNNLKCEICGKWKFSSNPCTCEKPKFPNARLMSMVAFQDWTYQWATEVYRVLKPGAILLAFGGTRTYHRMVCAIEDAGFEIRDCIMWVYGSGFPKSLNIGKAVDKLRGNERVVIGNRKAHDIRGGALMEATVPELKKEVSSYQINITKGNSEWEGWGTALKPAVEPIVVARKPLSEKTVAENVLRWRTGGINIDGCRVGHNEPVKTTNRKQRSAGWNPETCGFDSTKNIIASASTLGRFPANLIHDGSDEVVGLFPDTKSQGHWARTKVTGFGEFGGGSAEYFGVGEKDKQGGSAARFFYCAKASKSERNDGLDEFEQKVDCDRNPECYFADVPFNRSANPKTNSHPTVKPIALMEYLIKMVTKESALVLDPFIGSGTTAIAARKLNRQFIGFEKEEQYHKIAEGRLSHYISQRKLTEVAEVA